MIIDENGKLFGKINVVDLLVVIFLLSLTPMFYFGYSIFKKKPAPPPKTVAKNVYFKEPISLFCLFSGVESKLVNNISVGDIEKDKDGLEIGRLMEIRNIYDSRFTYNLGGKVTSVALTDSTRKDMFVNLKILPNIKGGELFYKGNKIFNGNTINFNTGKYQSNCKISEYPKNMVWVNIQVEFDSVLKNISEMIKEFDSEKDKKGNLLSELIGVLTVEDAHKTVYSYRDNKFSINKYPGHKDLSLNFKVLAEKKDGMFYYKNGIVNAGRGFNFQTFNYYITGKISGISILN